MAFHQHIPKLTIAALLITAVAARAEILDQITAEALRNNPELRSFEATVGAAKGGVRTARTIQNPELSIAPGVKRLSNAGNSQTEFHGNFELSQLFQFPGNAP